MFNWAIKHLMKAPYMLPDINIDLSFWLTLTFSVTNVPNGSGEKCNFGRRKLHLFPNPLKKLNVWLRCYLNFHLTNYTMSWLDIDIVMTLTFHLSWLVKAFWNAIPMAQRARSSWVSTFNLILVITQAVIWPWNRYDLDLGVGREGNSCQF